MILGRVEKHGTRIVRETHLPNFTADSTTNGNLVNWEILENIHFRVRLSRVMLKKKLLSLFSRCPRRSSFLLFVMERWEERNTLRFLRQLQPAEQCHRCSGSVRPRSSTVQVCARIMASSVSRLSSRHSVRRWDIDVLTRLALHSSYASIRRITRSLSTFVFRIPHHHHHAVVEAVLPLPTLRPLRPRMPVPGPRGAQR